MAGIDVSKTQRAGEVAARGERTEPSGQPVRILRPGMDSGRSRLSIGRMILASSLSELRMGRALQRGSHAPAGSLFQTAIRYVLALVFVGMAVAIRELVPAAHSSPFLLFFFPVLLAAAFGGLGPGLLATVTAGLAATITNRDHSPISFTGNNWWHLALFVVEGGLATLVTAGLRESIGALARRSDEQAGIATFTLDALGRTAGPDMADAACRLLCSRLEADSAGAWEATDDGSYRLTAGEGFGGGGDLRLVPPPELPGLDGRAGVDLSAHDVAPGPGIPPGIAVWFTPSGEPARPIALSVHRSKSAPFDASERLFLSSVAAVVYAARGREASETTIAKSEQRLRLAQATAGIGTFEWDLRADTVEWSENLRLIMGLGPGESVGTLAEMHARIVAEDREAVAAALAESQRSGHFESEYRIARPDGAVRWIHASGQNLPDAAGAALRMIGVALDITEAREASRAIAESEQRFRQMSNAAPVLIWGAGVDGLCNYFNDRWLDFTGRTLEEALGNGWADGVHPEDFQRVVETYVDSFRARVPFEIEYRLRHHSGEYCWVLDRGIPIYGAGEEFSGFLGSCIDITDRRRSEDSLALFAQVADELGGSLDYDEALLRLARISVSRFCDLCLIDLVEGDALHRVVAAHQDRSLGDLVRKLQTFATDTRASTEATRVAASEEPSLLEPVPGGLILGEQAGEEAQKLLTVLNPTSALAVPLVARGRSLGTVSFVATHNSRRYDTSDLDIAREIAHRAALSLDNARLFGEAQATAEDLRHANSSLQFIADSGADLAASSLNFTETLHRLARLSVDEFADWCSINIVEGDLIRRADVVHRDPEKAYICEAIQALPPLPVDGPNMLADIVRSGEARLRTYSGIDEVEQRDRSPEHFSLIQQLGISSAILIPLSARGRTLGVLLFVRGEGRPAYSQADVGVAEELGRRAAIAMDNANLYSEAQMASADLRRANDSLQFLADAANQLTFTLDYTETIQQSVRLPVPDAADLCTLDFLDDDGSIRRVAIHHHDPALQALAEQLVHHPPSLDDTQHPVARAIRDMESTLYTSIDDELRRSMALSEEHFELLQKLAADSSLCVPLVARGRTLGAIGMSRLPGRTAFDEHDLRLAQDFAARVALAIDNSRLFTEAQRSQDETARTNDNLTLLDTVGQALAASIGLEETLDRLGEILIEDFADACLIDVLESAALQHVVVRHRNPAMVGVLRLVQEQLQWDSRAQNTTTEAIRQGRPQLFPVIPAESIEAAIRENPSLAPARELGLHSLIMAPLVARGRTVGMLTILRGKGSEGFGTAEQAVAAQLGRRAGMFVDNARLYSLARTNAAALTRANDGLRLLADVGASLGQSLDYEDVIARIPGLVVPRFADLAWLDVKEDSDIRRIAVTHRDPSVGNLVARLQEFATEIDGRRRGVAGVIDSGEPCFLPELDTSAIETFTAGGEQLEVLRELHPTSLMAVPLRARGRVLGAMTFCLVEPRHHYTESDLALALDLAGRAALFIDNARLYTEAQTIEADLRRANEAKDEFLGMMSHELRTPITVINGGARLLNSHVDGLDDASRTTIYNDIEHESERLFRMVENLLLLSRVELNEEPNVEPLLLQRQLKRIVSAFAERRPDRPIEVQTEPDLPPAWGEPAYLEHVLRNLLSNADKYSPVGEPIAVTAEREETAIAVRVLDRGVGITEEEAELIFQRFYRSERTARLVGGSGMGLAVCKRLVDTMSGTIWARRREGGGLEVGFTLPLYEEAFE